MSFDGAGVRLVEGGCRRCALSGSGHLLALEKFAGVHLSANQGLVMATYTSA
jgi:hypothetical protein